MDARQAFKFGFMARCVEAGLTTPEQIGGAIKSAMDKSANPLLAALGLDVIGKGISGVFDVAKPIVNTGLVGLAAAPPALGALGGYVASRMMDASDPDIEDVKNRELVDEYHRQAQRMRTQGLLSRYVKSPEAA